MFADVRQYAKQQIWTQDLIDITEHLRETDIDPRVLDQLPLSLTSAFSRIVAADLNQCSRSIDLIKQVLSNKGFLQVNLHVAKWQRGIVDFSVLNSESIDVRIIGSKSAISDFEAKHGTINYLISRSKGTNVN